MLPVFLKTITTNRSLSQQNETRPIIVASPIMYMQNGEFCYITVFFNFIRKKDTSYFRPLKEKYSSSDLSATYKVHGVELGRTQLQFIAAQKNGHHVMSKAKEIQVFPPLRLEPRNITIIIGATFQVRFFIFPEIRGFFV